jgi:hypothetical protein
MTTAVLRCCTDGSGVAHQPRTRPPGLVGVAGLNRRPLRPECSHLRQGRRQAGERSLLVVFTVAPTVHAEPLSPYVTAAEVCARHVSNRSDEHQVVVPRHRGANRSAQGPHEQTALARPPAARPDMVACALAAQIAVISSHQPSATPGEWRWQCGRQGFETRSGLCGLVRAAGHRSAGGSGAAAVDCGRAGQTCVHRVYPQAHGAELFAGRLSRTPGCALALLPGRLRTRRRPEAAGSEGRLGLVGWPAARSVTQPGDGGPTNPQGGRTRRLVGRGAEPPPFARRLAHPSTARSIRALDDENRVLSGERPLAVRPRRRCQPGDGRRPGSGRSRPCTWAASRIDPREWRVACRW